MTIKGKIAEKVRPAEGADRNLVDTAHDVFVKLRDAEESAMHKRLAKQMAPWGIGATVAGAALLGLPMREPASLVIGGLADAAVIAGLYLPQAKRITFTRAMAAWAREHPVHTALCGIAAWVWYTAAVILGISSAPELMVSGFAGLFLLSARWWNTYRLGYPGDDVVQAVEEELEEIIDRIEDELDIDHDAIITKWERNVAAPGKALPGTRLTDREDHASGSSYLLHLQPGSQTLDEAINAMSKMSTALGVPQRNLLIEDRRPTDDDPEPDPAILKFQVITKSPIRKTVPLEGPRWNWRGTDLIVDMGPFADGVGEAPWRLMSENSLWGGFVAGTTGAGKSALIDSMVLSFMDTGLVQIFYVDPQNGGSSPALFEHATWSIGDDPEQQEMMLTGLETLIKFRGMENSVRLKTSGFTATPQRPGIVVVIDECHMVFNPGNAKRWALVTRVGRKVGVAIVAASQIYGLESFGGEDALRQSLESANAAIMRIGRNQAALIPGTTLNPSLLPQIPGYGVIRATSATYNRSAPFRAPYAKDEIRAEMIAAAARKMPALDALAVGALDNLTEGAYTNRHQALEDSRDQMERELQALEAGLRVAVAARPVDYGGPMGPELETLAAEYGSAPTSHGLIGVKKVIYEAIVGGTTDTASLLDAAKGMGFTSESWFYDGLKDLQTAGLIQRGAKSGVYELRGA